MINKFSLHTSIGFVQLFFPVWEHFLAWKEITGPCLSLLSSEQETGSHQQSETVKRLTVCSTLSAEMRIIIPFPTFIFSSFTSWAGVATSTPSLTSSYDVSSSPSQYIQWEMCLYIPPSPSQYPCKAQKSFTFCQSSSCQFLPSSPHPPCAPVVSCRSLWVKNWTPEFYHIDIISSWLAGATA